MLEKILDKKFLVNNPQMITNWDGSLPEMINNGRKVCTRCLCDITENDYCKVILFADDPFKTINEFNGGLTKEVRI